MTKTDIAKRLRALARELDDAWEAKRSDESVTVELNGERVAEIEEKISLLSCEVGGHEWEFDQCGQWHHKYCLYCNNMQYPAIASLSCNDFNKKHGKMTEKEYCAKVHQRENRPPEQVGRPRRLVGL